MALWPGAGEGHARAARLRAHPLLAGGVVEGPVFGRKGAFVSAEAQHWLARPWLVRTGIAAFVDVATASRGTAPGGGRRTEADLGAGARFRLPGEMGTLRVDVARGLRDGRSAVTIAVMQPH
jgi:hypothetical protein